jgi:hypothetical protein
MGQLEDPNESSSDESVDAQRSILMDALDIYKQRNAQYHDSWKHSGWRGALFDMRKKVERAWKHLFNAPDDYYSKEDEDELIDIINYAVFCIRAIREGNRDGKGGWW